MAQAALLIVGNWKSYVTTSKAALDLVKSIDKKLPRKLRHKIVLTPSAPFVGLVRHEYGGKRMDIGMQDVSLEEEGASTGSVLAASVVGAGSAYCIVGHAERRRLGESNADIARKIRMLLDAKVTPIVCVGEESRDVDGRYFVTIENQVAECLSRVLPQELPKIVIAYEPVWAIGSSAAPAARVVSESLVFIRKTTASLFGRDVALKMKLIYGGAVDAENASDLLQHGHLNGFLIGRASVDADNFVGIVRACQ